MWFSKCSDALSLKNQFERSRINATNHSQVLLNFRFIDFDLIRMLVLDLPSSILQRDLSNRVDQVLQKINPVLPKVSPSTCFKGIDLFPFMCYSIG